MMKWTTSSVVVSLLLEAPGIGDRSELLEQAGLSEADVSDPNVRVPWQGVGALIEAIIQRVGDPGLGLKLGEGLQPGAVGLLYYLVRNSQTLGQAAQQVCRFGRLLSDLPEVFCGRSGNQARFALTFPPTMKPLLLRPLTEAWLGGWLTISRQISNVDWSPNEARFQYPAPQDLSNYHRVFRCPIHFDQLVSEIVFDAEILNRRVIGADVALGKVLEASAYQLTAAHPDSQSMVDRVHRALIRLLPEGEYALDEIASRLAVSQRTLQRRLNDEGTTFRAVIDDVRQELALRQLQDKGISTEDLAVLLGFSTPSAFYRAFKRWTKNTPGDYRRATSFFNGSCGSPPAARSNSRRLQEGTK